MTVWIVTLNSTVECACESAAAAGRCMDAIKALPKYAREVWRPVGSDGWASQRVTSLRRRPCQVQA
jgi:hypothetical protein